MSGPAPSIPSARGHLPAIALGTVALTWIIAYFALMPAARAHAWLVLLPAALALLAAGAVAGRYAGAGVGGGALVGLAIGAINLLALGSLLSGDTPGAVIGTAFGWTAGFVLAAVVLGALGAVFARRGVPAPVHWTATLAVLTAAIVLVMVVLGGVVTGLEAGLSIRGWLTAEDYPLVLFPLKLMRADAGVFAEHAHRLWGLLTGLASILLLVHLHRVPAATRVRLLAGVVLAAIILQGVAGGLRITEQSIALAIAHGIFAQVVFAAAALVALMTMRPSGEGAAALPSRGLRRSLASVVLLQVALGAVYRHLRDDTDVGEGDVHVLLAHIVLALAVAAMIVLVGGRAAAAKAAPRGARHLGGALLALLAVQLLLGIAAAALVLVRKAGDAPPLEVLVTTAHQATGAAILASAVLLGWWEWGGEERGVG